MRLVQLQPEAGTDWLSRSSWIDLVAPNAAERDADDLEDAIDGLAEQEDLVGKFRLCLMDGQRDLKFLCRQRSFLPEPREWLTEMLGDIETLLPHNAFLSEKADFLLNTAQGFLNIEQSQIMKIFSIVAWCFCRPP